MTTESPTEFATFAATVDALRNLNTEEHGMSLRPYSLDLKAGEFFLDCKTETGRHVMIGRIYECRNGYYCVAVDGDAWLAPIVWNGPRASWDTATNAETLAKFAAAVRESLANA